MYGYWVKPDGSLIEVPYMSGHIELAWKDMGQKPNHISGYNFAYEQGWVRLITIGVPSVEYNGIPKITSIQARTIAEIINENPNPTVYLKISGQEGFVPNKKASLQLILTGAKPIPKENRFSVVVDNTLTPAHSSNWYHLIKLSSVY